MNIISIIPARGGSKGVPLKNIHRLNGKPLIFYTIKASLSSKLVDRTIVSTDHAKIASIAKQYGAEVIKRPKILSGNKASSEQALLHVIEHLKKTESYFPDIIVFLQCTSPFTYLQDIDGTIDKLIKEKADCAFTVTRFHHFLWEKDIKGNLTGINHYKENRQLRQKIKPQYLETGSVYVMKAKDFIKKQHRFFGKITTYEISKDRCLEIDEEHDFKIAESLIHLHTDIDVNSLIPHKLQALVLDFDGVFTDNGVIVFQNGQEAVICNRSDGMGLEKIKKLPIQIMVISKENNPVVEHRCNKLGVEFKSGIDNKLDVLIDWLDKNNYAAENVIYLGNDENDLECMEYIGCPIAVNDAHLSVKKISNIILRSNGGKGAIRELCDLIMEKH